MLVFFGDELTTLKYEDFILIFSSTTILENLQTILQACLTAKTKSRVPPPHTKHPLCSPNHRISIECLERKSLTRHNTYTYKHCAEILSEKQFHIRLRFLLPQKTGKKRKKLFKRFYLSINGLHVHCTSLLPLNIKH